MLGHFVKLDRVEVVRAWYILSRPSSPVLPVRTNKPLSPVTIERRIRTD